MIDTVIFENQAGEKLMPYEHFGVYMKNHSISPPKPKLYRFALDGRDGELDLSDWAGDVKFEPREINIGFRDLTDKAYREIIQFTLGRMIKVSFSDDYEHYYSGRCSSFEANSMRRVSDGDMVILCEPYRLFRIPTIKKVNVEDQGSIVVRARRMPVTPTVTATAACTITYNNKDYEIIEGTQQIDGIRITDKPTVLTITGNTTVSLQWTDGEL